MLFDHMREFWSKFRRRRRTLDDDLGDEIRSHIDFLTDENIARGMAPDEARAAARRDFGNATGTRERAREAWQFPHVESILQDLRYGLRAIRNAPAFSLVVVLTLALGIGANTAIFSVVYSVLLRPLPYPHGERLVVLNERTRKSDGFSVTWGNYRYWRAENHTLAAMAGYQTGDFTMTGRGDPVLTHAGVVTSSFFHLIGARPMLGRLPSEADDRPGAPPTVLVSEEFWAKKLGADPSAVGSTLALNGEPYEIIGVVNGPHFYTRPVDFYVSLGRSQPAAPPRTRHGSISVLALLKPGVTLAQTRADLSAIMQRLAAADPGPEDDHRATGEYLAESRIGEIRSALLMLMGAVALVLIVACGNVASLLLVRGTARAREIAIRSAIGAGRSRLARQLLTENLTLAALGGALGVLLAAACLRGLIAIGPRNIPRLSEASLDLNVLAFAIALTLTVGLIAGLAPVLTAGKVDLTTALKEGAPSATGSKGGQSLRSALVVAEIAITLVLAFGSGLLIRSLIAAQNAYPGFDPHNVLAIELQLPPSYKDRSQRTEFYDRLKQDVRALPGVLDVGGVNCPPSAGDCGDFWYSVLDHPAPARGDVPVALFNFADENYFRTMRIRLRAGRAFADTDRTADPPAAIVNETFARKWWPSSRLAVGQQIKYGGPYMPGPAYQIAGVVEDVGQMGLDEAPLPEVYLVYSQKNPPRAMVVMVRTHGDPAALMPAVRRRVARLDRNLPIQSLKTMDEWLGATLQRRRFNTLLLLLFAALAMILAGVGIYGVLNYWVNVREKEIAIRIALGARRSTILAWAGWEALRLAATGIVIGALAGWGSSRWLESLVYGVSARNPQTMIAAVVAVALAAALAASVPLLRATGVDPVRKLHDA